MKKMYILLPIVFLLIYIIFHFAFYIYYLNNLYPHCSIENFTKFECKGWDFYLIWIYILDLPVLFYWISFINMLYLVISQILFFSFIGYLIDLIINYLSIKKWNIKNAL